MMWYTSAGWGWWMLFGFAWMVVFWGLIIWAVYTIVSRVPERRDGPERAQESALDILERRYASGELTEEQFDGTRQRLGRSSGDQAA